MLDAGMSAKHVAMHAGCSNRAIQNLRIRFRTTGSTNDVPRRGHPRARTRGQDIYIMNTHLRNRFQTATATAANTPGFTITESVRKVFVIVCGRTVYVHDVLTSDGF